MKWRLLVLGFATCLQLGAKDKEPGWRTVHSKEGRFVVLMPDEPLAQGERIRLLGCKTHLITYVVERKEQETAYIVLSCALPEAVLAKGSAERRLDRGRDLAVSRVHGQLVAEKKINLGDYPGRELSFAVEGKGLVRQRVYAVKGRLYQLLVAGPREVTGAKDADRFFQSFQLKK
jgi:hypothetical protein